MPERVHKLSLIVEELEQELESLDSLDDETRRMLRDTIDEVRAKLDPQTVGEIESQHLIDRLHDAEGRFQVTHPTLSGIVMRVINALGQLGI